MPVKTRCRRLATRLAEIRLANAKAADRKKANSTSPEPSIELMSCGGRYGAVARAKRKQETMARHSDEHARGNKRRRSLKQRGGEFVEPAEAGGEYGLLLEAITS